MTPGLTDGEPEMVPVAFLGRTSSAEVQDPTLSIPRQLNEVKDKLPRGWTIVAHYWDVESGGLALDDRGRGRAHELFDVPVPRDGGLLDLRREAGNQDRPFAAVMCSAIERSARENLDSLQLERDLERLGVPLLAADEPLTFDRSNPSTILFRRFKQGIAEWYRLDLKKNAWSGMRAHTEQGWNTGPVPYGFLADRVPHPVPAKRAEGKTKTRLALDPERAHVVTLIYQWRVLDRMGYEAIGDRLNGDTVAYPPPSGGAGIWTWQTVRNILANPKYTGYMVWNQESAKGGKVGLNDRSEWVWSLEPSHPPLISRELFDKAAEVGRLTERSRQGNGVNPYPETQRTYVLRSYVRCSICGRRMIGKDRRGVTYYRCKTDHTDPRTLERYPDHPNGILVREDSLHGAIEAFFAEHVFGPRRGELFRQHFDAAENRAHAEYTGRVASLEAGIITAEKAKRRLVRELESMPDDDELAAELRADIHDRYRERDAERRALVAELEGLMAQKPEPPEDPSVLEELPIMPLALAGVAEDVQRELFGAFGLVVGYDKRSSEVELSVRVTSGMNEVVRMLEGEQRGALPGTPLLPCPPPTGGGFFLNQGEGASQRGSILAWPFPPGVYIRCTGMAVRALRGAAEPVGRALLTFVALADATLSMERWLQHHPSVEGVADFFMGMPAPDRLLVAMALAIAALYFATRPKRAFRRILLAVALAAALLSLLSAQPGLIAVALADAVVAQFAGWLWPEEGDPASSLLGWSLLGVAALCVGLSVYLVVPGHRVPHLAPLFAVLLVVLAFLVALSALALLDRNPPLPGRRDVAAALPLYLAEARSSVAPFALMRDKRHFWASDGGSFQAFACRSGVALALGPPIGAADSAAGLQVEFRAACRRRGWRPAWYQVPGPAAAALPGTRRFLIGGEALVDVDGFGLEGRAMAGLRHQVTKASRLGVSLEVLPEREVSHEVRGAMRALAAEVAARSRLGEMTWSVGRTDDPTGVERTVGLAFHDGRLAGYVTWLRLPAARMMVLDEVKRGAQAPSGTVELLIATCLGGFRGQADVASLGLAPITGAGQALVSRALRDGLGLRAVSPGLYAFKSKFRPTWEPRHLVVERLADVPAVLLAALLLHHPDLARRSWALMPRTG